MNFFSRFRPGQELVLASLMLFQGVCVVFFVVDVIDDIALLPGAGGIGLPLSVELFANLGLIAAVVVEAIFLRRLIVRHANAERALSAATGALGEVMQNYFSNWGLTPSECDVAAFTIKGFSIAEIAGMRQSAEGTVKSQLNAIYRKSGLAGRGQLVSLLIEDLLNGPLPQGAEAQAQA